MVFVLVLFLFDCAIAIPVFKARRGGRLLGQLKSVGVGRRGFVA